MRKDDKNKELLIFSIHVNVFGQPIIDSIKEQEEITKEINSVAKNIEKETNYLVKNVIIPTRNETKVECVSNQNIRLTKNILKTYEKILIKWKKKLNKSIK